MLKDKYTVKLEKPTANNFIYLRSKIGWGDLDKNLANKSLEQSLFHVTVYDSATLIAMGRLFNVNSTKGCNDWSFIS